VDLQKVLDSLGIEAKALQDAIVSFPSSGDSTPWTYENLQNAVDNAKRAWEGKKRFLSGKAQKTYHDVMCTLDSHSALFAIIPSNNTYTSVVVGAVTTLVKVGHCRSSG
jgi:uncharacterized protein YukE